jgi:hypothetical protein
VDTHLKVAGKLIDPKASLGEKLGALARAGLFYAWWYPTRWIGWSFWPRYGEFGRNARHMRFVQRASGRLARTIFHAMIRFGPKLEKRQAVLGRLVEIGAELLAMSATVSRAQMLYKKDPSNTTPLELADLFCRQARRRVRDKFRDVWSNDDVRTYAVARKVIDDKLEWLEAGIVERDE